MLRCALFLLAFATAGVQAFAQAPYPSHPIHVIVPFTAGSATDVVARTVCEAMARSLGQPVVVENRPGAGGSIGAGLVAKAPADGYTLLAHSAGHVTNPSIYPELPYDTLKDFAGITLLASLPNVLVTSPSKGFKSAADLVQWGKANPGKLNYGSAGTGSATHMNAEIFRSVAGFSAVHIPFRGTPEAMTETLAGRIDFLFAPIAAALPQVKEGRLVALAVGTAARSPLLPDVPTTVEAGFPRSEYQFWVGLLAPAGVPREILERLHAAATAALESPEVRERFAALGAEPMPMKAAAFDAFLREETVRIARVVHEAGIRAQ